MANTHFSGPVNSENGFVGEFVGSVTVPAYTVTTANALATKPIGKVIYVSNGLAGAPCLAVGNGTIWVSPAGTEIAAS